LLARPWSLHPGRDRLNLLDNPKSTYKAMIYPLLTEKSLIPQILHNELPVISITLFAKRSQVFACHARVLSDLTEIVPRECARSPASLTTRNDPARPFLSEDRLRHDPFLPLFFRPHRVGLGKVNQKFLRRAI